ncbi:hypothetical protein [Streptomyces sp. NBC_01310]|uniref:hypothetical protein n=1 Tax=Streptomyces sp. NBC_01310 TaxID=2903820 RepID=UPI003F4B3991
MTVSTSGLLRRTPPGQHDADLLRGVGRALRRVVAVGVSEEGVTDVGTAHGRAHTLQKLFGPALQVRRRVAAVLRQSVRTEVLDGDV